MAQVFKDSLAARLGSALGQGLGSGLQILASNRLSQDAARKQQALQQQQTQQEQQRYTQALMGLNVPQGQAQSLSGLPEKERLAFYQRGGLQQPMALQQQPLGTQEQPNMEALLSLLSGQQAQAQQAPTGMVQQAQQPSSFLDVMGRLSPAEEAHERRHQEDMALKERLSAEKRSDTAVLPVYRKAQERSEAAQRQNIVLDRMKELTIEGNEQQFVANFSDWFKDNYGINLAGFLNADTAEMRKLETFFLRDLKNVFGGRISNQEMERFMQGVPSLMMNREGRLRIIEMMGLFNKADIEKINIMEDLLDKNPSITPFNFDKAVNNRMKSAYNDLEKEFHGISKNARRDLNKGSYKVGQSINKLPDPSELPKGTRIRSPDGTILVNDGNSWQQGG